MTLNQSRSVTDQPDAANPISEDGAAPEVASHEAYENELKLCLSKHAEELSRVRDETNSLRLELEQRELSAGEENASCTRLQEMIGQLKQQLEDTSEECTTLKSNSDVTKEAEIEMQVDWFVMNAVACDALAV